MGKLAAQKRAGGFSNTSKMPSKSWGTSAADCKTGGKLRTVAGSACAGCYAHKGAYLWTPTKRAHARRSAAALQSEQWRTDMIEGIGSDQYFRWFDSGDLRDLQHLQDIVTIARQTPETSHWLPTQERGILKAYKRAGGIIPDNLVVRVSRAMIDATAGTQHGENESVVLADREPQAGESLCPAYTQDAECRDCRACWDKNTTTIAYPKH